MNITVLIQHAVGIDQLLSELFRTRIGTVRSELGTIVDFVDCSGKIVTGSGTVTCSGKRRGGELRKASAASSATAQIQAMALLQAVSKGEARD